MRRRHDPDVVGGPEQPRGSRAYRRAGFSETGDSEPLPGNPAIIEDQLALDLE